MKWPQILMIVILSADMGMALIMHGKKKEGDYNAWTELIGNAIIAVILYFGGFWTN